MKTIGIFKSNCPTGWTRLSAWDDKFLRGSATFGETGGSATHVHTVNYPSVTSNAVAANGSPLEGVNIPRRYYVPATHTHSLTVGEGYSDSAPQIPPCIDVVFCYVEG